MVGGTYKGYQEYKPFPFNREFLCPYLPEERSHPNISAPIISATDCCGESAEERKLSTGVAALAIASPATSAHTGDAAPSTATAAGVDDDTAAAITVAPPSSAPTVDGTDEGDSSPEHIPHIALRTSGY